MKDKTKTGVSAAGGGSAGVALLHLLENVPDDAPYKLALTALVPFISIGTAGLVNWIVIAHRVDPKRWSAERRIRRKLKQIKKALADPHLDDELKRELKKEYNAMFMALHKADDISTD